MKRSTGTSKKAHNGLQNSPKVKIKKSAPNNLFGISIYITYSKIKLFG